MTATTTVHGQPVRRVRAGEYQVTIGGRHYRIAGSPLTRQYTVTVDGQSKPVITAPGGRPFRTITDAARELQARTRDAGDRPFALLRERARELRCDLWADWTGSTVTGYVFTCAFSACRTDTRRARYDTPEAALAAAQEHWNQHQQPARQPAAPVPAGPGLDIAEIAARARVHAEEQRAGVASHPRTADNTDRARSAAASAAVSVAVGQVFPPMDGPAYLAVLGLVGQLRGDRRTGGADKARSQLEHHHPYPPKVRAAHAARLQALAEVLDQCGIDLLDGGRAVRELRAFAAAFTPTTEETR